MSGRYTVLEQIQAELNQIFGTPKEPASVAPAQTIAGSGVGVRSGRDVHDVTVRGLGVFRLTSAQQRVVAELIDALANCSCPDVDERYLLAASGVGATCRRLADVFAGNRAWGVLVVPGARTATYRICLPENKA